MGNKILIVEDEYVVANALRLILTQAGYSVSGIADSADEVDDYLKKHKPDLVLLDIRLNGKQTGIDIARKLKAENIAFIYLSANSSQTVLEEAKATEPYGFLVKPFREKDLLVTLDIAWYRHKHSLETKLRQEELVQKQLRDVINETSGTKEKLLKVFRMIQSQLPFDLVISLQRPLNAEQFIDAGYLRTGFDEYQFIGEKELATITGLKRNALSLVIENSYKEAGAFIYSNGGVNESMHISSLQKILSDRFKLESYLIYPVALSDGSEVRFLFCSRQHDIYFKHHIDLLNRLKINLAQVAGKTDDEEISPDPALTQPEPGRKPPEFKNIIGSHPLLLAALDLTAQVAPHNTSVLILGESGTGKEQVAQSIHSLSPRKKGPFIKVNCATIPATLIESELFGHEKGAFTGAFEKRKGKFEQAEGGTIFLDEIGELPLDMQVKLLRVLQEKEIETVGGSLPKLVNVRIVAATNRNLEKEVAEGKFRLDLYYRLNVFPITLPPLRDRKSDIGALVIFFANKFCQEFHKTFVGVAAAMMEDMYAYNWPGNIRELENVLERCVILNDGKSVLELKRSLITEAEIPRKVIVETFEAIKQVQRETEREYIISILKKTEGRIRGVNGAAELLNIKPTTLESKMAKLDIKKGDFINPAGDLKI